MKIVDIIEYEGDNKTFVWKSDKTDFNTLSQLIVHESQEALLFSNGQALDLFSAGRYTLHTNNIPLLSKIINIPTDGKTPFHCEVYFINKTEQMAIEWGVGEVNFLDPTYNDYAFKIGAHGEMSLRVVDSRKLIIKLVGTETILKQEMLKKYFKAPIMMHVKSMLPNILREKGISIFEVEANLPELSKILKSRISDEMADYGIVLEKFWINSILKPETDPFYITLNQQRGEKVTIVNQGELDIQKADYKRKMGLIDHTGEVQKRMMDIDTKKYEQEKLGFTYQQQRGFDVMDRIAENEGSGSELRNAAMGIGMGVGAGGVFGDIIGNIANSTMLTGMMKTTSQPDIQSFSDNNISASDDKKEYSSNYNEDSDMIEFKKKIDKLNLMKNTGFISAEEFEEQKRLLLEKIRG